MDWRSQNRVKGKMGESVAADYLVAKGYRILARNFRSPRGELDIVAMEAATSTLVCVEVKCVSSAAFPFDDIRYVVGRAKMHRLWRGFADFIASQPQLRYDSARIDVVCLYDGRTVHIKGEP